MVRYLIWLTAVALLSLGTPALLLAGNISLFSERNGECVVEVVFDSTAASIPPPAPFLHKPGFPRLHYVRFYVAVPAGNRYTIEMVGESFRDAPGPLPKRSPERPDDPIGDVFPDDPGFFPSSPFVISGPYQYRNTSIIAVDCYGTQADYDRNLRRIWNGYRLRIQYPPEARSDGNISVDPFVSRLVINRNTIPSSFRESQIRRSDRTTLQSNFSMSPYWVKIGIENRGIYTITGNDLFSLGFSLDNIPSASIRLFTAGGIEQARTYTDDSGTWLPGNWMDECSILIRDGGDGFFGPQDSLIFYAVGVKEWRNYLEPGAPETEFYDHPYAMTNTYFLSWGDGFIGGQPTILSESATPGIGPYVISYENRLHFEENFIKNFDFGGDGWLWQDISQRTTQNERRMFPRFQVTNLVQHLPQQFFTWAIAPYCGYYCDNGIAGINLNHHAKYWMNSRFITEIIWNTPISARYGKGEAVSASGFFLEPGENRLTLEVPRDLNPNDFMFFDFYSISYHRYLTATGNSLAFSSADTSGNVGFELTGFAGLTGSESFYLFDVTNQFHPKKLDGVVVKADTVRFASLFAGERKHFWACTRESFLRPGSMTKYSPKDLRHPNSGPNMLIICDSDFTSAAEVIRSHRLGHLPYYSNPEILIVTTEEVFDNFSGGVQDPMAIRNYCKFLYDRFTNGGASPDLAYLLLLGDANTDYKHNITSQPNYVLTNLNLDPISSAEEAYATDEWFVLMDEIDEQVGYAIPDIAIGRLPAASTSEAQVLVDKVILYETNIELGPWRDKLILLADDEVSTNTDEDAEFIIQSEFLANSFVPDYIDIFKIYLTEFPKIGSIKPAARRLFIEQWNSGAILINYIGHGSSQQMADEQVFLGSDVGALNNGVKLPLLITLSCTIGDFDNAVSKSLAEKLLLRAEGGAIGVISASQSSYVSPNFALDTHFIQSLFRDSPDLSEPIGLALIMGKLGTLPVPSPFTETNNQKYNLLGDPASQLLLPRKEMALVSSDIDTITAGSAITMRGSVLKSGSVDTEFSGEVYLFVRESDDTTGYLRESDGFSITYRYPGGVIFQGTADVEDGTFQFDFHVPRYPSAGARSYAFAYTENSVNDAVVVEKTIDLVYPPPGTPPPVPLDGPPDVELGFKGGLKRVKPGAVLQAKVVDADGVNILSTTNEGKQILIFDDTNLPLDVTDYFTFDHGGSDTSGVLQFPLPDISVGEHSVIYKVGDSFGQVSLDTLSFTVIDPMANYANAVFNYPNPFRTSTHFLFHLSSRASIQLDIFTTSGKKIRSFQESHEGGEAWIYWNGRDMIGDTIANGVYLYVADVQFDGDDSPATVLRGKVVKVE